MNEREEIETLKERESLGLSNDMDRKDKGVEIEG